jgi:hypothetical protein
MEKPLTKNLLTLTLYNRKSQFLSTLLLAINNMENEEQGILTLCEE